MGPQGVRGSFLSGYEGFLFNGCSTNQQTNQPTNHRPTSTPIFWTNIHRELIGDSILDSELVDVGRFCS